MIDNETDADLIAVCPECDSAQVYKRQLQKHTSGATDDYQYRCTEDDCGHTFDDPEMRERQRDGGSHKGVGRLLEDANPEDWP